MRFLALDTETGGTSDKQRFPVSIGLTLFDTDNVAPATKEWLVRPPQKDGRPKWEYTEAARLVHGYSYEHLGEFGKPVSEIYKEIAEFVGGVWARPIVSHRASFDADVWSNFIFECGAYSRHHKQFIPAKELLSGPWICTHRMAGAVLCIPNQVPNLKLETLLTHFGVMPSGDLHGSGVDSRAAGDLYLALRNTSATGSASPSPGGEN